MTPPPPPVAKQRSVTGTDTDTGMRRYQRVKKCVLTLEGSSTP